MKTSVLVLLFLHCTPLLAAGDASAETQGLHSGAAMLQLLMNLGLVLGMILLAAWLFRKLNHAQARMAGGQWMQIRASLPLGFREKLLLVQVGQEYLVLGITQQRVECLARMDHLQPLDDDAFAQILKQEQSGGKK